MLVFVPWYEGHWWWIGPIWFRGYPDWIAFYEDEQTVSLSLQDLRKVRKTAVFVEEDTRDVGYSRTHDPFAPPEAGRAADPFAPQKRGHMDDPFAPGG
jgi:hypothetical protein